MENINLRRVIAIGQAADRPSPIYNFLPEEKFNFTALRVLGKFMQELLNDSSVEEYAKQYWSNPTEAIDEEGHILDPGTLDWHLFNESRHDEIYGGERGAYPAEAYVALVLETSLRDFGSLFTDVLDWDQINEEIGRQTGGDTGHEFFQDVEYDVTWEAINRALDGPIKGQAEKHFRGMDPALGWDFSGGIQENRGGADRVVLEFIVWPKDPPSFSERFAGYTPKRIRGK